MPVGIGIGQSLITAFAKGMQQNMQDLLDVSDFSLHSFRLDLLLLGYYYETDH